MNLHPEEISGIIKSQIKHYKDKIDQAEVGTVVMVGDGIAKAYGLENCMSNELLEFEGGEFGIAQNLEENSVSIALLSNTSEIKEGDIVRRTRKVVNVPVGEAMLGRVVNALGEPIDGKGAIFCNETRPIESEAPGIIMRKSVKVPLQTGIKAIDSMIPIGRGQRELIIGDRQTGKTSIAVDAIINQKSTGVLCVYVAIGQKNSTVAQITETLRKAGALDYTVIVSASASETAPLQYISHIQAALLQNILWHRAKMFLLYMTIYLNTLLHIVHYHCLSEDHQVERHIQVMFSIFIQDCLKELQEFLMNMAEAV